MTLFDHVAGDPAAVFAHSLQAFHDGRRDSRTLALLG
jgi:uncharacterized protein (DUF1810 family)